jgi:trimethylamine--corrinoid protein Co-methyltransferase
MNRDECTPWSTAATQVLNADTGERRPATHDDWVKATHLIDALDEFGVYWKMVGESPPRMGKAALVAYFRDLFANFTKHVQEATGNPEQTRWLLEVMQVVFGEQERIRRLRPVSFLVCPVSPLVLEGPFTDACLETLGWGIPIAVMPMPLLGMTSPGRLISTIVLGNCETLAMLVLLQAAAVGTPVIYAPAPSTIEPYSGRFTGGAVEHAILYLASAQMGRYYGLPVETSTGGTEQHLPGIQSAYERAINWTLPTLAWPDILVGPGMFEGSTVFCFEQLMIDVEVFRYCQRLHQGIASRDEDFLEAAIDQAGPGGNFLADRSTRDALRQGELYISPWGQHDTYELWLAAWTPTFLDVLRLWIDDILDHLQPFPLDESLKLELDHIEGRRNQTIDRSKASRKPYELQSQNTFRSGDRAHSSTQPAAPVRGGSALQQRKSLRILESHGAKVNWEAKLACIPEKRSNTLLLWRRNPSSWVQGTRRTTWRYRLRNPAFASTAQPPLRSIFTRANGATGPGKIMRTGCVSFKRWTWVGWPGRRPQPATLRQVHGPCMNSSR